MEEAAHELRCAPPASQLAAHVCAHRKANENFTKKKVEFDGAEDTPGKSG
jgi:hypothetical protein